MELMDQRSRGMAQLETKGNKLLRRATTDENGSSDMNSHSGHVTEPAERQKAQDGEAISHERGQTRRPTKVQSQSIGDNTDEVPPPISKAERPTICSTRSRTEDKVSRSGVNSPAVTTRKAVPTSSLSPSSKFSVPTSTFASDKRTTRSVQHSDVDSAGESDALQPLRDLSRKERDGRIKSDETKNRTHREELEDLLQHISALEANNQALEQKYQEAASKSKDYATRIRTLQERAHKHADSAEWMPDSATDITVQLDRLASDIRKWSKNWAWHKPDGSPYKLSAAKCATDLEHLKDVTADVLPRRGKGEEFKQKVPLWLLLSAALSHVAFTSLIGDPFFAFRASSSTEPYSVVSATSLESLLATMRNSNEAGAEAWRSQLIRLLDPVSSDSAATKHNKDASRDARKNSAAGLAHQCISTALKHMIKKPNEDAYQELTSIFLRGAELGWSLWAQKMRFEVLGVRSLQQLMQPGKFRFDHKSEYLQADRLNATALDKRQEALDGRPIALVVSPAVVAIGTADGTEYDLRRVWKDATVLIDD